jgi:molecular chaperone GrpE
LDNIDRAVEAAEQGHDTTSLLDGLKLVQQQLRTVLTQCGCSAITALHQPFDPNLHEAISQMPSHEHAPGTVIAVASVGHQLHGRVVRPSQVVVAVAPDSQTTDAR